MRVVALEKITVGQHGEAGSAVALVALGDFGRVEIGAQQPLARTRFLDFGDDRRLTRSNTCANGVGETAHGRCGLRALA